MRAGAVVVALSGVYAGVYAGAAWAEPTEPLVAATAPVVARPQAELAAATPAPPQPARPADQGAAAAPRGEGTLAELEWSTSILAMDTLRFANSDGAQVTLEGPFVASEVLVQIGFVTGVVRPVIVRLGLGGWSAFAPSAEAAELGTPGGFALRAGLGAGAVIPTPVVDVVLEHAFDFVALPVEVDESFLSAYRVDLGTRVAVRGCLPAEGTALEGSVTSGPALALGGEIGHAHAVGITLVTDASLRGGVVEARRMRSYDSTPRVLKFSAY
jgi:hypothetical protein